MWAFFANNLAPKNFKPKTQLFNFWRQNIGKKSARKTLMKLTTGFAVSDSHRLFAILRQTWIRSKVKIVNSVIRNKIYSPK